MATKRMTTAKAVPKPEPILEEEIVETEVDETPVSKTEVKSAKTYDPEDLIMCKSITSGGLYVVGGRTNFLYTFADYGDEVGIEYQDLVYAIRSHDISVYEPRFIIEDSEIVENYPEVDKLYSTLYSFSELKDILKLSPANMRRTVLQLPKGAIEGLKGIVSTMIDNGTLDSVQKIKVLDEILGTNFLVSLTQA